MAQDTIKKKSLRLALIASGHTLSDYSMVLQRLLVGMVDASIPVVMVCPPRVNMDPILTGNVEVVYYPFIELPLADPYNRRRAAAELAKFGPTVMHCLCESRARFARRLSRRLNVPYVLSINSLESGWAQSTVSAKRCSKILVPAKTVESSVRRAHARMADRIEHVNYGTFIEDEPVCFDNPDDLPSIVVAYPVDSADDFQSLFAAMRHLIIEGYEFAVAVMGCGRAESQLYRMLKAFDLLNHVAIVPRLTNWPDVLAAGDIFVRPGPLGWFDPLLLEAMAKGSAVAACAGGVDDLLIPGETAVIFDRGDELSATKALQGLLDTRERARELAESARQHIKTHHSASGMIDRLLRVYDDALAWSMPGGGAAARQGA
ncbi:MAG TPA: glycosyltransferase [Phycisphaerales bacterium]|nr:glycosyltransferase [Phycisphaerales bacterium]